MKEVQCWKAWVIFLSLKKKDIHFLHTHCAQHIQFWTAPNMFHACLKFLLPKSCNFIHSTLTWSIYSSLKITDSRNPSTTSIHCAMTTKNSLYCCLSESVMAYNIKMLLWLQRNHFLNTHRAVVWGIRSSLCAHCIGLHHDYVNKQTFKISYNIYTKIFLILSS